MTRSEARKNVVTPPPQSWGNDGGNGSDDQHGQRLARLEEKVEHLATKSDIQEIKTLIAQRETAMLRWLMGIMAAASITIGVALLRLFLI